MDNNSANSFFSTTNFTIPAPNHGINSTAGSSYSRIVEYSIWGYTFYSKEENRAASNSSDEHRSSFGYLPHEIMVDPIEKKLKKFQGSYIKMMINEKNKFQELVNECKDYHLCIIVKDFVAQHQRFIDAAFYGQGATSMTMLIMRLRESHRYAFIVTEILSTRLLEIMTDDKARVVIQCCFTFLGYWPNKILYEKVIEHCKDLATHKVGCTSLYGAIEKIYGVQRRRLLNHIADSSDYLAYDQYGNYVVQHVLSLEDESVNARIVERLKGKYVELSMLRGGSHVVEKCIEHSKSGIFRVFSEIINTGEAPYLLANDEFGNYVIQKVLKKTKGGGFHILYDVLVESLLPYCTQYNATPGWKNVLKLLNKRPLD